MIEQRDEELSRIYRDAEAPGPSQRLDDNILAASQRVAGARPRPAGFGFARRWGTPFALAATVVVTFTLTLMVFEREPGLDTNAPRADRPAKVLPAEPTRAGEPAKSFQLELKGIAPVMAPPVPQGSPQRDRAEQRPAESAAKSELLGAARPAFVPEVPRAPEALRRREEAKPASATAPAANLYSIERAPANPVAEAQGAPEIRQQVQPAQAPAAAAGALSESVATAQSPSTAFAIAGRIAVTEAKERTPEKWLEDIRKLRTEGKTTEAERELAEFRKRYPDYRLPEDLR